MSDESMETIPKGPDDMPSGLYCEKPNLLRNMLVGLNEFSAVDIHWENDWRVSNATGEPAGHWEVTIITAHNKQITSKHEDIENALWYASELAENADCEEWQRRETQRKAALAKLTPEDRKALRLRD